MCLFKSKRRTRMVKCTSRLTTPVSHCNVSRIIPKIYSLTVHEYPLITRRRVIKYWNESMIALKIIKANWKKGIEERKRRKRRKMQREPLFFTFPSKETMPRVWRLVQQRDIGLPSYLRLVTANTFRSSRVSISGLSYVASLHELEILSQKFFKPRITGKIDE